MKRFQEYSTCLAGQLPIFAALLLMAGCATQAPVELRSFCYAKVTHLKGAARYRADNTDWRLLKAGDLLKPGTLIQTAANSRLDLVLGNGPSPHQAGVEQNLLRLWENTVVGIDTLTESNVGTGVVTEIQLDLKAGHIYGEVDKLSGGSKYEVKLPSGVAGIRGAVFDISADGLVKVLSGTVVMAVVGVDGMVKTQVIMGGQEFDARKGVLKTLPNSPL